MLLQQKLLYLREISLLSLMVFFSIMLEIVIIIVSLSIYIGVMYLFRYRILIVDKINHIHFSLLIEIDDTIVNGV